MEEAAAHILVEHQRVETEEGWIDCSCGWQSNHPRLPTRAEQEAIDDPEQNDPPDHTGEPDPEHLGNDEAWTDHIAALMREFYAAQAAQAPVEQ